MAIIRDESHKETIKQARIVINQWVVRHRIRLLPWEKERLVQMIHQSFRYKNSSHSVN